MATVLSSSDPGVGSRTATVSLDSTGQTAAHSTLSQHVPSSEQSGKIGLSCHS